MNRRRSSAPYESTSIVCTVTERHESDHRRCCSRVENAYSFGEGLIESWATPGVTPQASSLTVIASHACARRMLSRSPSARIGLGSKGVDGHARAHRVVHHEAVIGAPDLSVGGVTVVRRAHAAPCLGFWL